MRKGYFIVYNGIAEKYNLSPTELLIFSYTLNFAEKLTRSENQLAKLFNVSKSTIHNTIEKLIKKNLLGTRKVKNKNGGFDCLEKFVIDRSRFDKYKNS
ncbi:MAG: MarR family transcriptional regulator [Muribaculaceae bacterium]|nr:MarR family transcriptional regulator [Muribaculaceae bacterium]